MPSEKKKPELDDIVKPTQGYLSCDTCGTAVLYRGYPVPTAKDPWPMHRCGWDVRPFDKFTLEDPTFRPIPKESA